MWVYREAMRVKREQDARRAASVPGTGDMIWLKPGGFTMGSIDGADDERPIHDVKVRGFFIDGSSVEGGTWRTRRRNRWPASMYSITLR